jgi:hypothetical protein
MWRWLAARKDRRDARRAVVAAHELIARFGALIERYPGAFIDETWLPAEKEAIKTALKIAWLADETPERRELIKTGWVLLSLFQPGVGPVPIDASPEDDDPVAVSRKLKRYMAFTKLGELEDKANIAELRAFALKTGKARG